MTLSYFSGSGLRAAQVLTSFTDPAAVVTSPFADLALVLDGEGDEISRIAYDPKNSVEPFLRFNSEETESSRRSNGLA
jgi:hypothetical protein